MRRIVYSLFLLAVLACFTCNQSAAQVKMIPTPAPERPAGQTDVLNLACDPIPTVRVAFIGLGMRGSGAVYRYTFLDGVEVKALCDLNADYVKSAQQTLAGKNLPVADEYTGSEDWKRSANGMIST